MTQVLPLGFFCEAFKVEQHFKVQCYVVSIQPVSKRCELLLPLLLANRPVMYAFSNVVHLPTATWPWRTREVADTLTQTPQSN